MSTPILEQILRRVAALEAFFELVTNHGTADLHCDMESFGREPGDIVTILVPAPDGEDFFASREMEFTAENVRAFSKRIDAEVDPPRATGPSHE